MAFFSLFSAGKEFHAHNIKLLNEAPLLRGRRRSSRRIIAISTCAVSRSAADTKFLTPSPRLKNLNTREPCSARSPQPGSSSCLFGQVPLCPSPSLFVLAPMETTSLRVDDIDFLLSSNATSRSYVHIPPTPACPRKGQWLAERQCAKRRRTSCRKRSFAGRKRVFRDLGELVV